MKRRTTLPHLTPSLRNDPSRYQVPSARWLPPIWLRKVRGTVFQAPKRSYARMSDKQSLLSSSAESQPEKPAQASAGSRTLQSQSPASLERLVGTVIDGRYRLDALLAVGGMGAVYRAEHVFIGRAVALKILHSAFAADQEVVQRFQREAQIAVRLKSPHVVDVLDFGRTPDERFFLVMELLTGQSLQALLEREGRLPPARAIGLLRQVLQGLQAAHAAGITHRDLKPENLWLVTEDGVERLKILDFGIAKVAELPREAMKTQLGLVIGTPEYLAPEQAYGRAIDHRADLYSLGIIAFVLLTGRHPFETDDARALVQAHATAPVPAVADFAPELIAYPQIVEFVRRATVKEAGSRAQSAAELLALLDGAEMKQGSSEAPDMLTAGSAGAAASPALNLLSRLVEPKPGTLPRSSVSSFKPPTENLAIMLTDIVGFTEKTSRQTREENARMLAEHDRLLLPVIRAFRGRKIKSIGDALLVTFKSPTDSVLCGTAIQDQLARRNVSVREEQRIVVRVAINIGEVRVEHGDVFGEPVNIVSRVQRETPPGEVWLTEAAYLSMNKSEVPSEEVGTRMLKGIPDPIQLYRVPRVEGPLPFGGELLPRVDNQEWFSEVLHSITAAGQRFGDWRQFSRRLQTLLTADPKRAVTILAVSLVFVVFVVAWVLYHSGPLYRAERAIEAGRSEAALRELDGVGDSPEAAFLKGRALYSLKRGDEGIAHYKRAGASEPGILARREVLRDLSQSLGGPHSQDAADLLAQAGEPAVELLVDAAADAQSYQRRWAAIEALRRMEREDRVDIVAVHLMDLKGSDCSVVSKAAKSLGEIGDTRAVEPLREVARRKSFLFDACEAPAARAALRKLEKK